MKVGQKKKDFMIDVSHMKKFLSCNDKSNLSFGVAQILFGSPANGLQVIKEVLGQRYRPMLDAHIPLKISFLEVPTAITCKKLLNLSE
jgi:hypothetical protein